MTEPRRKRSWRLMFAAPRTGAVNMARDVALLRRARDTGEAVFSVYGWTRPTLSLGRNQSAKDCYDVALMKAMGVDVVRRPTGGRALLHHREVTYSVTAPVEMDSNREAYQRINEILLNGLKRLGVDASVAATASGPARLTAEPCFTSPARGELVNEGRKLVGSAQLREDGALLQHGSILIENDQSIIALLTLGSGNGDSISPPATLANALGRTPLVEEVAGALFEAVRELEDPDATSLDESELRADMLAQLPFFENELWTWRR